MVPPIPKGLSLKDLMTGLVDVHKAAAARPGAQAFEIRDLLRGKTHGEMAKIASDQGIFGKLKSGEPVRASVVSPFVKEPVKGNAPQFEKSNDAFGIVLHGESKKPKLLTGSENQDPTLRLHKDVNYDDYEYHKTGPMWNRIDKKLDLANQRNLENYRSEPYGIFYDAPMYQIDALNAGGNAPRWGGYKSQGTNLYQLGFDMSRAPGGEFGITADDLTGVNMPRRIRNALSHYFGHGDFGTVAPMSESKIRGMDPYSTQSFAMPIDDIKSELDYINSTFPDKFGSKLKTMGPRSLAGLTDDQIAGYLLMREAQLANVYGPPTAGLGPFDLKDLRALSTPVVRKASESGSTGIERAFGPNTLGRALTTEETVARMLRGQTPEEISYELFKNVPDEAFKGRYAKGGLATALDT
jgi:hypothetical protein